MSTSMFHSIPTARKIPNTAVHCIYCDAEIELDSVECVNLYNIGQVGMVCPECGNFTKGGKS